MHLSVVIPVYNEEAGLAALFARLYPALDALGLRYEVIFVNDGSRDRSAALLREQFARRPEVTRVVLLNGNFGQHMAIMAGFERVRVTKIRMTDQGCMLRAYSRDIVEAINACREVSTFIPALAYTFARAPSEVEVAHEARAAGTSKYSVYSLVRLNFDLVTGFSVVPLQIFSLFGIGVAIVSVIVYLVVMIERVLAGEPLDTLRTFWDRDILQFFLIGIVLFGLGLVGEYVGRIYQQVRERP